MIMQLQAVNTFLLAQWHVQLLIFRLYYHDHTIIMKVMTIMTIMTLSRLFPFLLPGGTRSSSSRAFISSEWGGLDGFR